MKKIKIVFWMLIGIGLLSTCSEDFLNTEPLDKTSSDATWSDGALSQAFVFNVYSFLGYGGFEEQGLSSYTDEAMFTHAGRNINTFTEGTETASNLAWFSPTYEWKSMYLAIREANIAIEQLPNSTFTDDELKDRLLGESLFLRAYYYNQLLRFYGGVPIIDRTYELNEDYNIARSSFEDCTNFIVSDLDQSIALLDGKGETAGRASKIAAMALKSRVLIYAASDLHDASAASAVVGSFSNPELLTYASGQSARWDAAKIAAKAVLDNSSGYMMDLAGPATREDAIQNHISISMGGGSAVGDAGAMIELIFQRTETPVFTQEDEWPLGGIHNGINNGPNGYHNWAGNTPLQQLVDDYEMMDGSTFDWGNPVHAGAPYDNRDPRFYSSILYDGADWKPRPADVAPLDPANQIQTGVYDDGSADKINGLDTRESAIESWNGSRTHYYVRKFIDPDPNVFDNLSGSQVVPWPFIRYTEAVLNYVEACIETGDDATAQLWLNKIRYRAGMPAVTETGTALTDKCRNERRLELAYEEHRYHDARRWLIAPTTVGRGIKVINVEANLKAGETPNVPYRYDTSVYDYTYSVVDNVDNETRTWDNKMYYRPISRDEVNRNEMLVQNPGY